MQGFLVGVIWYLVLTVVRASQAKQPTHAGGDGDVPSSLRHRSTGWPRRFLTLAGGLLTLGATGLFAFAVGFHWGERSTQQRESLRQRSRLMDLVPQGRHAGVTLSRQRTVGLAGTVADPASRAALREELTREFGDAAAGEMLREVEVHEQATRPTNDR